MFLYRAVVLVLVLCLVVPRSWAICKESDNFVFECQQWEDALKLTVKDTVKQLVVKNGSSPIICDASTLQEFPNLSVLNVQPGTFTEIKSDCFKGLPALSYVQIMENHLKSVALDSLNRSIVERLWLDGNQLKELKLDGVVLPVLRSLGLSNNLLKEISITSENVPDLRILDLSFNNLTKVNVESLSISFLKLHGNLLDDLSAVQLKGKFIQMLYLSENKLKAIKGSFFAPLPRAEYVHFEKNPIATIDFANFNVTSIRCIDDAISINRKDHERPLKVGVSWEKVETLIVSNNSIDRLDVFNFTKNFGVLELLMDHNNLREIKKDDLRGMETLMSLDLSYNKISSIEDAAFDGLENLHTLSLAHNCIHGLSDQLFSKLNTLFRLDLSTNIMTYFMVNAYDPSVGKIILQRYHPFFNVYEVKLDHTLLRTKCQGVLKSWMTMTNRHIFSMEGVEFSDADQTACEAVPLRDPRIEKDFAYCHIVEEATTDTPSAELDPFYDI